MLVSRVIPCLLIKNKGLVKTTAFKAPKYVGDPINAVRIFNEKQADELMLIDIDATTLGKEPDYKMIEHVAEECRMPLCYGGGIKYIEQARRIFSLGVEKVALSSAAITSPELVGEIAAEAGAQSTVIVLDFKKRRLTNQYEIYTHNGSQKHTIDLNDFLSRLVQLGMGELVVNSIDRDGRMQGYDYTLIDKLKAQVKVPITVLGGAGSLDDLRGLVRRYKFIGAAAGSLFVFKGKYKAVLISYPTQDEKAYVLTAPTGSVVKEEIA